MTTDLIKLRELAEAATPGEWVAKKWTSEEGETYGWNFAVNGYRLPLCEMETDNPNECDANAAYIAAANPAKVIELLDALEALGREVAELKLRAGNGYSRKIEELIAERDQARAEVAEWRKADAPNGWINHLREECNSMASKLYASPASKDAGLVAALQKIADWNSHSAEFSMDYGSNGLRDLYRQIARDALSKIGGV